MNEEGQVRSLGRKLNEGVESPYVLFAIGNGGKRVCDGLEEYGILDGDSRVLYASQADFDYYISPRLSRRRIARIINGVYDINCKKLWDIDEELDEGAGIRINPGRYPTWVVIESDVKKTGNALLGGVTFAGINAASLGVDEIITVAQLDGLGIAHIHGERNVVRRVTYDYLQDFLFHERRPLYRYLKRNSGLSLISERPLPRGYVIEPRNWKKFFSSVSGMGCRKH